MAIQESGNFITQDIIDTYQSVVVGLRNDLGRYVTIILPPKGSGCSNCLYDSIRKTSAGTYNVDNPFPSGVYNRYFQDGKTCPICNGKGQINIPQSGVYKSSIRWINRREEKVGFFNRDDGQIGNVPNADVRLKIAYSGHRDLQNCVGAIIDGIYCERVEMPISRGLGELFVSICFFNRKE